MTKTVLDVVLQSFTRFLAFLFSCFVFLPTFCFTHKMFQFKIFTQPRTAALTNCPCAVAEKAKFTCARLQHCVAITNIIAILQQTKQLC